MANKNIHFIKIFDRAIIIYTGTFMCYRALVTLTSFVELFKRPVFGTVPDLLGIAGVVLLAGDLFTERTVFRSKNVRWILLLLLALSVSTAIMHPYNSALEFAKYILYVSVQDLLMYSAGIRMNREEQKRFLKTLHTVASVIMIPALCYMIYQFVTQQHYITYEGVNQGWFEGRLFGITHSLYGGAIVVALLVFGAVYLLMRSKRLMHKCLYAAELVIYVIYLALSDCRTVYVACAAGLLVVMLYGYFRDRSADKRMMRRRAVKCMMAYLAALVMMYAGISGIRGMGAHVIQPPEHTSNVMSRPEGVSFSSRRLNIWKNYVEIMTDRPAHLIFGLSYNGYERYIRAHYPDAYIVSFFKEMYPYGYQNGEVYQTHNSYLMVWVVAGIPGLLAVLGFLLCGARRVFGRMRSGRMTPFECLLSALILMVLTAGVFETTSIIPVSAVAGFFWMTAGLLLNNKERSVKE